VALRAAKYPRRAGIGYILGVVIPVATAETAAPHGPARDADEAPFWAILRVRLTKGDGMPVSTQGEGFCDGRNFCLVRTASG
jgi:hypothetical protein